MDVELRSLIREHYPFPIAHAHKKTLACLDDDAHKLKCLIQAAEAAVQFLALVMLAQLHHDLAHQQAPALGQRGLQLRDDLRNPSFGKWHGLLRDLLKQYHAQRHLLVMPELFEVYFQPGRGSRLAQQPVVQQAIEPLITLRNQFHHPGIPDAQIPEKVAMGTHCLEQLLERLQFLHAYPLNFVQRIEVRHDGAAVRHFRHDLVQMQGCFSIFERQRWESDVHLREGRLVLLTSAATGRSLFLDPFFACAEELPVPGVFDIFLLNGTEQRRARFLSAQCGQELSTDHPTWAQGAEYIEALGQFFDLLRRAPTTDTEVELESAGQALPAAEAERAGASTEESSGRGTSAPKRPEAPSARINSSTTSSPRTLTCSLAAIRRIRQLQRKFHAARLLILHGESGTGKTSLIRAGLLPRLSPESYVPVYVRALQEPARAIKEAMVRQLGVDQRHLDLPLAQFLDAETAHLSKTVVVILDQFEEFFLRLPLEVRRLFHQELGACVAAAHLDVHFIIALRDDYFSSLAEFQEAIPELFTHEMRLARFTHAQALAAAVEPVKRVGWSIDEALIAEVILPQLDELEKGIEPPLLQIVCDALYQQAQDAGRTSIGAEEYAALGDVRQALGRYLDATLRQFGPQQPQARAVLKALVTAEGTKRASFVDEIVARLHSTGLAMTEEAVERDFLRKLVQARLVRVEDIEGRPRYELAHEFLVQQIGTWIADSERELTKVLELIDRAYEAYRATGLLLEPEALALIAPFQDELVVPAEKQRFLDVSRQTARRRRRGLWLRVGALLLLVGLGVGGFFGVQVYRSNQQLQASNQQLEVEKAEAKMRSPACAAAVGGPVY